MPWLFRAYLLTTFVIGLGLSKSWAQTVFRIDSLPTNGVALNKAWKWHLGDNPDWARVDFDDANWDTLNPRQDLSQLTQLPREGIGWLRIHLYIPPALRGRLIGMFIGQAGATEVFLNEQLVLQNGKISPQNRLEKGDLPNYVPAVPFSHDSLQVMAVRYTFSKEGLTNAPRYFFAVRLLSSDVATTRKSSVQQTSLVDTILIGVFLIMGILQLLLYTTATNQRTNLYFGLFLGAQCLVHVCSLLIKQPTLAADLLVVTNQIVFVDGLIILFLFFLTVSVLFYLVGIYRFFNQPKDTPFFIAAASNAATLPVFLLVPSSYTSVVLFVGEYLSSAIIPFLAILRVGMLAIKQKKQGAILFTISHTTLLVTLGLMGLGDVWPSFSFLATNNNYFFLLSFLSLAVTISLLLSQERSATNKLLRKQLLELDLLSQKTLSQEQEKQQLLATQNERLEQQVEVRTAELKASQAQLIQQEKLASLGELTAGIAHEIQNPLNFVNNFSELSAELVEELKGELIKGDVKEAGVIADDLVENLQKIHHHGGRASNIVKSMLEHSRTGSGESRSTDLNALANEYLKIAYQGLKAKHKSFTCGLVTEFDPSLEAVKVVPQEIGRVLLNLYNNAFYAVSERAKSRLEGYQPQVRVSTKLLYNWVEIRVSDNGTGIPESLKAKIFQPFFTTKPTGEGTGLGLSLSHDIITKGHGGSLSVESQNGEGTELVIRLPALS